jgi:CRP-like cAMP-binding protein
MNTACPKFLSPLGPADQALLTGMAHPWTADAEEVLYQAGHAVPGIWMLDVGMVRYEFVDHGGRQVVPAFSTAGACFGELEILEQRMSAVTAITATRCEGWVMPADSLIEAIETVPAFSKLMLLKLARNVRICQSLYQMALVLGPHERLALALLNLAQAVPGRTGHGILVAPVTQETLCQVTGSSRQMVSKYLRQWSDLGWVAPRYRSLEILNPQGLMSISPASIDPPGLTPGPHRCAPGSRCGQTVGARAGRP